MATATPEVTGQTGENTPRYSLHCNCEVVWSLAQQFAMRQIVEMQPDNNSGVPDRRELETTDPGQLHEESIGTAAAPEKVEVESGKKSRFVGNYAVRARRIAAAYARMYLEEFEHLGDKTKKGRFYWPGLAAFAAKQVAVTLEELENPKYVATAAMGIARPETRKMMYTELGLGNVWIYNDILPWYYVYAIDPESFDLCVDKRDSRQLVDQVQKNLATQQGYEQAKELVPYEMTNAETGERAKNPGPGFLKATKMIRDGFKNVANWEKAASASNIAFKFGSAYNHLIAIARHEQGEVLQALIYDNKEFARNLWLQRNVSGIAKVGEVALPAGNILATTIMIYSGRKIIPPLQLVMTSTDEIQSPAQSEFVSEAPSDTVLENYKSRMIWIKSIANKYHKFMQGSNRDFVEGELVKISKWSSNEDKKVGFSSTDQSLDTIRDGIKPFPEIKF